MLPLLAQAFYTIRNINLIDGKEKYIKKDYNGLKFIHIKTKNYKSNGFLRIFSLLQFSIRLFLLRKKFDKPDIIIHTAQVPFENLVYYTAKSLKVKFISEVLDLWPESFVAYGLINKHNPLFKISL